MDNEMKLALLMWINVAVGAVGVFTSIWISVFSMVMMIVYLIGVEIIAFGLRSPWITVIEPEDGSVHISPTIQFHMAFTTILCFIMVMISFLMWQINNGMS